MTAPAAALRAAVLFRRHAQHGARRLRPFRAMASSSPDASAAIWADVQSATERAVRLGKIFSIDTGTELVTDARSGVQFVVRVAKALRDKPKADMPAGGAPKPPAVNPFLPYDEAMYVRHLAPHHVLLLNKFNVVPHHLLLVTREFAHQTEPLDAADCAALGVALRAFPPPGGLAFMNVGDASGFSQPHKHVQLVPLPFAPELPHAPVPVGFAVERAAAEAGPAARAFHARALPFWNVCASLAADVQPQQLADTVAELVLSARAATGAESYNLLITAAWVVVVPRAAERGKGVAVNALGFAGTMLVRSTEELERVRADPMAILTEAGFPW